METPKIRKIKVFKAAVFKVKLSNKKANIIDTQMRLAESAYYKALGKMAFHIEPMQKLDKKGRKQIITEIKKQVAEIIQPLPLSTGSKGAVIEDVAAQISSTVELKLMGQDASLPGIENRNIDNYKLGMKEIALATTKVQEDVAKALIYSKPYDGMPRPLHWLRTRKDDGAMILKDDKNRFFIYLNSHSAKSRFATNKISINNMLNTRTGESISFQSRTGILAPLELSKWHQEEFIEKAQAKSYKLIKREDGYYLSTSFEFEVDAIEVKTLLGIVRSIDAIAAYSVTHERNVIESGVFSGLELKAYQRKHEERHKKQQKMGRRARHKWRGYGDTIVYMVANKIVDAAVQHQSQVVMEELGNMPDGYRKKRAGFTWKTSHSKMLRRAQYQKLQRVLTYKLRCAGLPEPRYVHAAGTSVTCNKCGNYDKENRKVQADFKCTSCGHQENVAVHASANIAMKLHWLQTQYSKRKKEMKIKFPQWLALSE